MASITLDRTRHFGQIYGQTENGAVFTQDGIDFRGDGTAIFPETTEQLSVVQEIDAALAAQNEAEHTVAVKSKKAKPKADSQSASDDEDLA